MNFDDEMDWSGIESADMALEDKWILSRLQRLKQEVPANLDKYETGVALHKIYSFLWEEFCDWYIEISKSRLTDDTKPAAALHNTCLTRSCVSLQLLHPFMPFVTESLYGHLVHEDESIMISSWPMPQDALIFPQEEQAMISLMDAIREIRNVRSGFGVPPSRKAGLILVSKDPAVRRHFIDGQAFLQRLAAVSTLETRENKAGIPLTAVTALFSGGELYLPLEDLIDLDKEIERLLKEKANLESELTRVSAKLQNQAFMDKAPEKVIQAERDKFSRYSEMHKNASERLILLQESGQAAESVI